MSQTFWIAKLIGPFLALVFWTFSWDMSSASHAALALPDQFPDEKTANAKSCATHYVKSKDQASCVLQIFSEHTLFLVIYDSTPNGYFTRKDQIAISSWHETAQVTYDDLLGDGRKFLYIEFEGNTGTGVLQNILAVVAWNNGKFVPALMETVSYKINAPSFDEAFVCNVQIERKRTPAPSVSLNWSYREMTKGKPSVNERWTEVLPWNAHSFSFYEMTTEKKKSQTETTEIRKRISTVRKKISSIDLRQFDTGKLQELGIMQILPDA